MASFIGGEALAAAIDLDVSETTNGVVVHYTVPADRYAVVYGTRMTATQAGGAGTTSISVGGFSISATASADDKRDIKLYLTNGIRLQEGQTINTNIVAPTTTPNATGTYVILEFNRP